MRVRFPSPAPTENPQITALCVPRISAIRMSPPTRCAIHVIPETSTLDDTVGLILAETQLLAHRPESAAPYSR